MAFEAAKMNYMDISVEFLRGLQTLGKEKAQEMIEIKRKVKELQISIINEHNSLVRKHRKRIGIDFRGRFLIILVLSWRKKIFKRNGLNLE